MADQPDRKNSEPNTAHEIVFPRIEDHHEIIFPSIEELQGAEKSEVPDWLLENIAELSKHVRTVHAVYVAFLLYCALTILSTRDRKIILDEQAHLPIVNLDVPFSGFVVVAPIAAIFIFIDFQIHLQVLKGAMNRAKRLYVPLSTGRLYPWIMSLVEEPETGLLGRLQRFMAILSIWCLMPFVLILVNTFTLKKHSAGLAALEWFVSCVGISLVLWLWHRYDTPPAEPGASEKKSTKSERFINNLILNWEKSIFAAIMIVVQLILLIMIPEENRITTQWRSVDLSYESLIKEQREPEAAYWLNLQGRHLNNANLYGSDLRKANLRQARLKQANLQLALLEDANLSGADIEGAILSKAKLSRANLSGANLSQANLNCAILKEADFFGANLFNAYLLGADLSDARNLSPEELLKTATLYKAILDPPLKDYVIKHHPELLDEPDSEEVVMKRFPPSISPIRNDKPRFDSSEKNNVDIIKEYTEMILVKAGSDSHLRIERFIHFRTRGSQVDQFFIERLSDQIPASCINSTAKNP